MLAEPIWSYQRSNVTSPPSAVLLTDVIWQPRTCEREQGSRYHVGHDDDDSNSTQADIRTRTSNSTVGFCRRASRSSEYPSSVCILRRRYEMNVTAMAHMQTQI